MNTLPTQMRVVLLEQYQEDLADAIGSLKVVERPVPSLRRGQVLVRIEAAPCNPSDLLLLQGKYGVLSEQVCGNIDPIELIFRDKTVTGFYLGKWLRSRGLLGLLRATGHVQRMLIDGRIATKVQRVLSLDEAVDGLKQYVGNMTQGKVLFRPQAR